ncbi:MAG: zinc ribbon domain-containing protein [Anaerolineales bacterium]|nr:zinc ribbon domain-containing protein [Anaerolineales bacterium]
MFRRGPFRPRRIIGPRRPAAPLAEVVRQALQNANRMMEAGDYIPAAETFERLAEGAQARGMLQRAPQLYLQAGRARLLANQVQKGYDLVQKGLTLLARTERWGSLHRFGSAAVAQLSQLGQTEKAAQLQSWLDGALKDHPEAIQEAGFTPSAAGSTQADQKPRLPAKCPFCGANIRPNEVEWLDDQTSECPYCGSPIPA